MKRFVTYAILLLLLSGPSLTWGHEWTIDANHSGFRFGVQHIFSTVWGHFSDFEVKIKFDPDNLAQSSFEAVRKN
jgi:polyisoprenoid-binding protein YceI